MFKGCIIGGQNVLYTAIKWGKCVENDKNESFVSSSNLMFGIFVFLKTLVNDLFWNAFWENLEAHALELWNMIWLYSWENSERISRLFVSLTIYKMYVCVVAWG